MQGLASELFATRQEIRHRARSVKDEFAPMPLKYMADRRTRGARRIPARPTSRPALLTAHSCLVVLTKCCNI